MQSGWVHEFTDLTMVRWTLLQNLQAMKYNTCCYFSFTVASTVLHSNLWQRKDYLHMHPILVQKKRTVTKREEFTQSETLWLCVCRMNFPLSQQGLNTHRVNIIGLNPGWVDIGLVWVRDFIFLSLTLVFAGCDLNSIGVICLSKAKTGTRRSWVCAHWNQGNSIRRHPYCVWGWDSSVDMGGLGLGDSTSEDCTISTWSSQWLRGDLTDERCQECTVCASRQPVKSVL